MADLPSMEQPKEQGFELVFGPRQIGAVLFVAVAAVGICSAVAYVAGKTAAAATLAPAPLPPIVAVTPPPPPQVVQVPVAAPPAEPEPPAAPRIPEHYQVESPKPGEIYLQVAAVPKGVADVFAAGFAARGRHAVIAPASSEAIVRVLVGPFRDKEDLAQARAALQASGFTPFVREYTAAADQGSNRR